MHTFDGKGCVINFNGDGSGTAKITDINTDTHRSVDVPISALADFVAELVRRERISRLEDMETDELLGLEERD